ncbi:unnamed protein product [Lampetra planeri]
MEASSKSSSPGASLESSVEVEALPLPAVAAACGIYERGLTSPARQQWLSLARSVCVRGQGGGGGGRPPTATARGLSAVADVKSPRRVGGEDDRTGGSRGRVQPAAGALQESRRSRRGLPLSECPGE